MSESYTSTIYVVDVHDTMSQKSSFRHPAKPDTSDTVEMTRLEYALLYVKARLAAKAFDYKKTDKSSILLFGCTKTKNHYAEVKEGDWIDYKYIYEFEEFHSASPDFSRFAKIKTSPFTEDDEVDDDGKRPYQTDAMRALKVAIENLQKASPKAKAVKYNDQNQIADRNTRRIVFLTDGEGEINWKAKFIDGLKDEIWHWRMELIIAGLDFDEDGYYVQEDKPELKKYNEERWQRFISAPSKHNITLENAIIGNACRAVQAAYQPRTVAPRPAPAKVTFYLGPEQTAEPDEFNGSQAGMAIKVKVHKAVMKASALSMKKVTRKSLRKREKQLIKEGKIKPRANPDDETESESENEAMEVDPTEQSLYDIDLDLDAVKNDRAFFYAPPEAKPQKPGQTLTQTQTQSQTQSQIDPSQIASQAAVNDTEPELEPVPQSEQDTFKLAYRYGGELIQMTIEEEDDILNGIGKDGIKLIGFCPREKYQAHLVLGESYYVFADQDSDAKMQIAFSALANALQLREQVAIVRYCSKYGQNKRVRQMMMIPMTGLGVTDDTRLDYFTMLQVPFEEDFSSLYFPRLEKVPGKKGGKVNPNENATKAFGFLIDSMDLRLLDDEEEGDGPWFDLESAFNPAIHNVIAAVRERLYEPFSDKALPEPHTYVQRYLQAPEQFDETVARAVEDIKSHIDVKKVPPKPRLAKRKRGEEPALALDIDFFPITASQANKKDAQKAPEAETAAEKIKYAIEISLKAPYQDFVRLAQKKVGDADEASDICGAMIDSLGRQIQGDGNVPVDEIVNCIRIAREYCMKNDEVGAYQRWLDDLRESYGHDDTFATFWRKHVRVDDSLSYIVKNEVEGDFFGEDAKADAKTQQEVKRIKQEE